MSDSAAPKSVWAVRLSVRLILVRDKQTMLLRFDSIRFESPKESPWRPGIDYVLITWSNSIKFLLLPPFNSYSCPNPNQLVKKSSLVDRSVGRSSSILLDNPAWTKGTKMTLKTPRPNVDELTSSNKYLSFLTGRLRSGGGSCDFIIKGR